jgi:hypothetical protein
VDACTVPFQNAVPPTTATAALAMPSSAVIVRARRVPRILTFIVIPSVAFLCTSTLGGGSSSFLSWAGKKQRMAYVVAMRLAGGRGTSEHSLEVPAQSSGSLTTTSAPPHTELPIETVP